MARSAARMALPF
jgi:hypothetical protein